MLNSKVVMIMREIIYTVYIPFGQLSLVIITRREVDVIGDLFIFKLVCY